MNTKQISPKPGRRGFLKTVSGLLIGFGFLRQTATAEAKPDGDPDIQSLFGNRFMTHDVDGWSRDHDLTEVDAIRDMEQCIDGCKDFDGWGCPDDEIERISAYFQTHETRIADIVNCEPGGPFDYCCNFKVFETPEYQRLKQIVAEHAEMKQILKSVGIDYRKSEIGNAAAIDS